jgi:hypothetical protein
MSSTPAPQDGSADGVVGADTTEAARTVHRQLGSARRSVASPSRSVIVDRSRADASIPRGQMSYPVGSGSDTRRPSVSGSSAGGCWGVEKR